VNGRPAVCVALSARGGLVELAGHAVPATAVRVELDAAAGRDTLSVRGRVVSAGGGRVALEWQEAEDATLHALSALVAESGAAEALGGARQGLWKRLQARAVRAVR
jgi:hypothetical protein